MDWIDLMSVIIALGALGFSIYSFQRQQERADKYAQASVKPLLSIKSQGYTDLKSIRLMNYGVGPAIIRKAEFRRDPLEKPTNRLVNLFRLDNIVWESFVNLPEKRAIPAGEDITLVKQSLQHLIAQGFDEAEGLRLLEDWQIQKKGILVRIEYEDIYGNEMKPLVETLN